MFRWYQQAAVCYVYLADVSAQSMSATPIDEFSNRRWLSRGRALQELITPKKIIFFSKLWTTLGEKGMGGNDKDLIKKFSQITGIPKSMLSHTKAPEHFSAAERISLAARRVTTRNEDMAHCLMGL